MKQTIEIEVPNGKKAVWKDNKVVFEDIKLSLPKTWEEFCNQYPVEKGEAYIGSSSNIETSGNDCRLKEHDRNLLPSREAAMNHLVLMQLHQLRDCYRRGWEPDWNSLYKPKYAIYKTENKLKVELRYHNNCFLSFQTWELANLFLTNFKDLIEKAGDLI